MPGTILGPVDRAVNKRANLGSCEFFFSQWHHKKQVENNIKYYEENKTKRCDSSICECTLDRIVREDLSEEVFALRHLH